MSVMRSRKAAGEPVEAGRDIVRLADEEDVALAVRLGLDERRDGPDRRRKKGAVGRETIGGPHICRQSLEIGADMF